MHYSDFTYCSEIASARKRSRLWCSWQSDRDAPASGRVQRVVICSSISSRCLSAYGSAIIQARIVSTAEKSLDLCLTQGCALLYDSSDIDVCGLLGFPSGKPWTGSNLFASVPNLGDFYEDTSHYVPVHRKPIHQRGGGLHHEQLRVGNGNIGGPARTEHGSHERVAHRFYIFR